MGILRSAITFGIKGYITWCAIDYTVQQGFWSDSDISIKAFNTLISKIKKNIPDTITNQIPPIPTLPAKDDITYTWNTQVINSAEYIRKAPRQLSNLIEKTVFPSDQIESNVK